MMYNNTYIDRNAGHCTAAKTILSLSNEEKKQAIVAMCNDMDFDWIAYLDEVQSATDKMLHYYWDKTTGELVQGTNELEYGQDGEIKLFTMFAKDLKRQLTKGVRTRIWRDNYDDPEAGLPYYWKDLTRDEIIERFLK